MTKRRPIPIASPSRRRTRAQSAWKVPACTSRPGSPTSEMIRSRSSPAARLVNVTARICHGRTPVTPMRYAIRWARTRVLPLPAPARMSNGPSVVVTARACSGLSCPTIAAARSWTAAAAAAARAAMAAGSAVWGGSPVGESPIHAGSSGAATTLDSKSAKAVPGSSGASATARPRRPRRGVELTLSL